MPLMTFLDHLPTSQLEVPVRSIMRAGVISVPDDASVRQVQRALVDHRVHAVLVVGASTRRPTGWATPRGVLDQIAEDTALLPAALAVTEKVESIAPSATAEEALRRLLASGAARLLVCRAEGAEPEGIVAEMDLLGLALPR